MNSSITGVFYYQLISTIFVLLLCAAMFFYVRMEVKFGKRPKWLFVIWAAATIIIAYFTIKGTVDLHCDIKEESFISYQGEFINRGGGQKELKTIVIYDESGKEIKLHTGTTGLDRGNYTGRVVYGRRSRVVVQIIPDSDFDN